MSIEVRKARESDAAFILAGRLESARASFPQFKKNATTIGEYRHRIRRAFKNSHSKIFIAEMNGTPAGFLWLSLESTKTSLEKFGLIQSLWVSSRFRREGIASILLKYSENFLRMKKYPKMRLTYSNFNMSMEIFSRKNGFRIRRVLVEKPVQSQI